MMREEDARPPLPRPSHRLLPGFVRRAARGFWRASILAFWVVYFSFIATVLVLRYAVLPNIEQFRPDIERFAGQVLGQSVSVGRVEASWEGINPDLALLDVRINDAQGRPAIAFSRIEAILSWWSVPSGKLKLRLLRVDEPTLNVRRDAQGRLFVAGFALGSDPNDRGLSDWVLGLRRIRINGATVVWEDALRNAPALVLEDLNFALDNDGDSRRFGLTALPPGNMASKIDLRGDFRGTDIDQMEQWTGQIYTAIDYVDLAVWRQWMDYPVDLPHGRGALRAWASFADGKLRSITADTALKEVGLRLAGDLPALGIEHVSGRVGVRFAGNGVVVDGRAVELAANGTNASDAGPREAIRVEPTDFHVEWQPLPDGRTVAGSATASRFDIGALAGLAGYMPFDAQSRKWLSDFEPRGRISGLTAKWKGSADSLLTYSLKAGFDGLALKAQGLFPGFSGLSGALDANEKDGSANLHAQKATIDVPSVFPEPLINLDSLSAQLRWKIDRGAVEVNLGRVEFAGPEAAGSAQGIYRSASDGPGYIDMSAALTRADARAVWRFMPHVVGAGARQWLHESLLGGVSNDAKLILKGNLADFPFVDKSKGQFLVTVKAKDAVLDYAKGWPRIEGISGDLRFEGNGMTIEAQRGAILGAKLSRTHVEIPDFNAPISTLLIKGQADGPTSEFLKFIDQSPVAERIDRFTEDMRALGNGHLDLALSIPLDESKLAASKIDGTYRLTNNEVIVDSAVPALKQVNGSIQFSGSDLRVPEINATLFGGPLRIKGGLQKDGRVLITANGSIDLPQLRKLSDSPVLDSLSGTVPYRGEVRINKRNADLVVESTLVGLSSSLPEPFNKTVNDSMMLRFEKELLPAGGASRGDRLDTATRDRISVALANGMSAQFIRKKQADGFAVERGAIAFGRPLTVPDSGISVGITAKRVDIDAWRRVLGNGQSGKDSTKPASTSSLVDSVSIKTPDLLTAGRHFTDVDLSAASGAGAWKIRLSSNQATGDLLWDTAGSGKLTARLKQLAMEPAAATRSQEAADSIHELPALDIVADEFSLGTRRFGKLDVQARNEGGVWKLDRINASNPFGTLAGSGLWQTAGGKNRTQLVFKLESADVGQLLDRLGYPGAVRAGTALLEGSIGWNGPPTSLDYGSLSGEMKLEAGKGQFVKLDPGAAGKLLGLISLQGLPRRISLDFKDVFSEGFSFDSMTSKLAVQNGLMRTERLQIDGPSARVLMRGEVDLMHETQRLNVNVQPELGGTAALGVALINPVAGVATWLAHKVLQNPLNQMFGFNYLVTGTWDDPKVEKLSGAPPVETGPRLPPITNTTGGANEPVSK